MDLDVGSSSSTSAEDGIGESVSAISNSERAKADDIHAGASFTAHTGPVSAVLLSEDILPEIVSQVKYQHYEGDEWKRVISQILVINKAFFHAGLGVLWRSMSSLTPALKLLPWFTHPYEGIGTHKYSASADWLRFNLYASHIRRYAFKPPLSTDMAMHFVVELLTLPGRPDPLFPNLQHVSFLGNSDVPSPFLLITPSLRTFERLVGSVRDPLETQEPGPESAPPCGDLMTVIPRLAISAIHLHSFTYLGPTSDEFFARICRLTTLKILRLTITSWQNTVALRYLRRLPLVEDVDIVALWPIIPTLEQERSMDALVPPKEKTLRRLRVLSVFSTQLGQLDVSGSLCPARPRHLRLRFFRSTDSALLHACIGDYLQLNRCIEELSVELSSQQYLPPSEAWILGWLRDLTPMQRCKAATGFSEALCQLTNISCFSLVGVPYVLARASASFVVLAMDRWTKITRLSLRVVHLEGNVEETTEPPLPPYPSPFPGLTFLARTVWKSCVNLQELEFHFDQNLVLEEDLTNSLAECRNTFDHPLRVLKVNTGENHAESASLALSKSRMVDIAMVLDRLFPRLEQVSGSAKEQWDEVNDLVGAFRKQRKFILDEVEGLLDTL